MMISITACAVQVKVDGVRSDGCVWTSPIFLSEPSIQALREAQTKHPEVRIDREQISKHNKLYNENCPKSKEK